MGNTALALPLRVFRTKEREREKKKEIQVKSSRIEKDLAKIIKIKGLSVFLERGFLKNG